MGLPIDDAVLLSLLVLFFAVQQRRRPESYFRFWLAGWVLALASVVARLAMDYAGAGKTLECLRVDALVCGGIAFLFSSVVSGRRRRAAVIAAGAMALPICAGLDLVILGFTWAPLLGLFVVVGEGVSLTYVYRFSRDRGWWLLPLVAALGLGNGVLLLRLVVAGRLSGSADLVLCQIFLTAGLLLVGQQRTSAGRWVGSLGFLGWGFSHLLMSGLLDNRLLAGPIHGLWMLPKYLVAFGMILRIFAEKNGEIAGLATRHRDLYEDYRVFYQGNPHPMWVYDGASLRFLSVNNAAIAEYGFSEREFMERSVCDLVVEVEDCVPSDPGSTRKRPVRHRRANGTAFDVELTEHTIAFQGTDARFVLAVDITEREELNRALVYQAQHDVLTGLPNRMVLEDRLMHWLARCGREGSMGALLTIDIDHFKQVNDTYGHLVGDECLKVTAERLRSRVRQVDTIARTGGEEFTIVVGSLRNRGGAETVCHGLLQVFQEPIMVDGIELKVTISIGAAMYPDDGVDAEELRRRSDQALYEAKRNGRNCVLFATPCEEEVVQFPGVLVRREHETLRRA